MNQESGSFNNCDGALIVRYPQSEIQALARKKLLKINTVLVLITALLCLLMGEGDVEHTLLLLKGHFGNILMGLCLTWCLQIVSYFYIGTANFWYCFYEDKIVFNRPPESEEFAIEEIREIQYVPLKPGEFYQPAGLGPENYFCISITLKNGREISLVGYLNMLEAWEFLSSRLPEKVTDHKLAPKQAFFAPAKIMALAAFASCWCLALYLFLPERIALTLAMLSLASGALPVLARFYQFGRPISEKHVALAAYFWLFWFLAASVYLGFF
ncbi:MAG: hypothetical protein PHD82_02025 [Candidatus Riflebacteria bacterium]|nr:hypothetical protein [Candidatus Riflebacteria bacterium]